ncbi:k-box superfamily domain-containing protein [Histoplasma capsulatum var. duboisii H88]|uniref:K-box superfamily domain-containing protein n=3 Tax=Ajellomyces capsulatus TaxID=5037 RepID=A0A8A1LQC8_AJEC8|nr:k-box superfamily domain-containing protein [Histoplasma capsulatum var. duboisii H88]
MTAMTTKGIEERSSQCSLAPPAEIKIPSTPIPSRVSLLASPGRPAVDQCQYPPMSDQLRSPVPRKSSSSNMTPPPSTSQHMGDAAATPFRRPRSDSDTFLASPPATIDKTLCVAYGASVDLPSSRDIDNADEVQLRKVAKELLVFAQEFRMSAAHFKLQHSLLSLTSSEAINKAEVEQRLAKREVEILQSIEYRHRRGLSLEKSPELSPKPRQADATLRRIKELEDANITLERRLRRAKRIIEDETDKNELLFEENSRLKKRIRENREHFTLMLGHASLASSPQTEFLTPQRKTTTPRYPDSARSHVSGVGSQDPIAALLAAGQVLHGENVSVHSTPSRSHSHKHNSHSHRYSHSHSQPHNNRHQDRTCGTHPVSSLPVTPQRSCARESQGHFFTPINKRTLNSRHSNHHNDSASISLREGEELDRHDRDSTISASDDDDEEALTDQDVPASQASSLATSMLRRYPGGSSSQEQQHHRQHHSSNISKSSSILQSKLFGHVKKAGVERESSGDKCNNILKRKSISYGNGDSGEEIAAKKLRFGEQVGLGIQS